MTRGQKAELQAQKPTQKISVTIALEELPVVLVQKPQAVGRKLQKVVHTALRALAVEKDILEEAQNPERVQVVHNPVQLI